MIDFIWIIKEKHEAYTQLNLVSEENMQIRIN